MFSKQARHSPGVIGALLQGSADERQRLRRTLVNARFLPDRSTALGDPAKSCMFYGTKKAGTLEESGLICTSLNVLLVEVGGIEPPSEGTPCPALHA
jgi:hypothetical protein